MRKSLLLGVLLLAACGKSDEQKAAEALALQLQEAGKQLGGNAATSGIGAGVGAGVKATDAVDFRELKALLPEELAGMKRGEADGQKSGAMGFTMSTAEASSASPDGNSTLQVKISDVGAMTGMGAMAAYAWAAAEIDRESGNTYEKTMTIKGYRGYEKYDKDSKWGELSVMVAGRFIVELNGNVVSMDTMKEAFGKLDLDKLESMKKVGVQ